jgi:phosphate transport system permease protein
MTVGYLLLMLVLVALGFVLSRRRAVCAVDGRLSELHSLPIYHGLYTASLVILPMLVVLVVGQPLLSWISERAALAYFPAETLTDPLRRSAALREVVNAASGVNIAEARPEAVLGAKSYSAIYRNGQWLLLAIGAVLGGGCIAWGLHLVGSRFRARSRFERIVTGLLFASATIAVLSTIGIVFSVAGETYRFFFDPTIQGKPTVAEFLFGTQWNPQAAMRADQGDIATAYGFLPLLTGTLLITVIAILVAGPLGLFSAIYLAEYASPKVRSTFKPVLEILAGIPTVVLGFFAALTVAPLIRGWGEGFGLDIASESALAAGLVMGMMIIPFISSLSDDVISAVPQSLRDGSYAMGATKSETIKKVVLPAALPGIVAAFMLAISRAIGETMIVVMAAGLAANLTLNPLEAVTTITVQIKTILVGDQEFDSAKTLAAFALGFVLFFVTLVLNYIALRIVRKYREQYD